VNSRRVLLIHWHEDEARERAARLETAGYRVAAHSSPQSAGLRGARDDPPDALVIDLSRLPSQGRDVAIWFRRAKAARRLPIVFIEGDPDRTERVRDILPDAVFTTWRGIRGALRRALSEPVVSPVVPGAMAGYSGRPLVKKLGIAAGTRVALIGTPAGVDGILGELPAGARLVRRPSTPSGLVLVFASTRADLARRLPAALRLLDHGGRLWIAWPKQASGVPTDLTQTAVRAAGLAAGLVDFKICAIDAVWSGLAFARRGQGRAKPVGK